MISADAALGQREYGFDNRRSSGQPYLAPQETVARFQVPDEFEVRLFAAEPLVTNPIALTIDEKGRVWVIECFEYPKRTPPGRAPRDRIVILEDTDGDGRADKRTVFAEGKDFPVPEERRRHGLGAFDLASGIEVGYGGVFVGAPPYLWFIENRDDKPGRFEVLLQGFGSQDTHETLNTFQWGPDGWLYGLHGIFTQSEVRTAGSHPHSPPIRLNAAVWRFHPRNRKFEIFAEGTSNPWGMDWRNSDGQFILCCCVIPHLFHIVPGGIYKRQAGASFHPYVYGYLNEICDHTFHKESGWAHAGLIALDVPHMPARWRNSVIFGSIHGCSIKQNILQPQGSTFLAKRGDDFLRSGDKNFRPINLRWGPLGDIYVSDWHDQHPCHQTNPDDWDYEHGRIYRIQLKGTPLKKAEDLSRLDNAGLLQAVCSNDPFRWRTALRLLYQLPPERKPTPEQLRTAGIESVAGPRRVWITQATSTPATAPGHRLLSDPQRISQTSPEQLVWYIRLLGEAEQVTAETLTALVGIAHNTRQPQVRRELASLAGRLATTYDIIPLLQALLSHPQDANDPVIPQLVWLAYEQVISRSQLRPSPSRSERPLPNAPTSASDPSNPTPHPTPPASSLEQQLRWLATHAASNPLIREHIVPRVMRRLATTGRSESLELCLEFLLQVPDIATQQKALEGLTAALEKQTVLPPANWPALRQKLLDSQHPQLVTLTQRLAANFRDPQAVHHALNTLQRNTSAAARMEAIRQIALLQPPEGVSILLQAARDPHEGVAREAVRALAAFSTNEAATGLIQAWPQLAAPIRTDALHTLGSRKEWARLLLRAVGAGTIDRSALTDNFILRLQAFRDQDINQLIEKHWGRTRPTPAELNRLIEQIRASLDQTPASFEQGRKVFETHCAKCHKFGGVGHEVGPPLDGAARDIDYILINVLDPNRVIGAPYFLRTVIMNDDTVFQGILAEEDDQTLTLKLEGGSFKTLRKAHIAEIRVAEKSLMPEGLANNMSIQDFRSLIRYLMAHPFITEATLNGHKQTAGVTGRFLVRPDADKQAALWQATFTATANISTKLLIGSAADYQIELDGRVLGRGRGAGAGVRPDIDAFAVDLAPGQHTLTIRVLLPATSGSPLYVRFLDPERQLRYPDMLPSDSP
jgi:putative membrane-bound dehydrogenase-like protein